MEIISAIGGLILGIFGSWIAYKNQTSPQREKLYIKQQEVYSEVVVLTHRIYSLAIQHLNATEKEKKEIQEQGLVEYAAFIDETSVIGVFCPIAVMIAHADLTAMLGIILNPNDPNHGKVSQEQLVKAYYQFGNSVRRSMGVDSLTEESMSLFKDPLERLDYLDIEPYHKELVND